MRVILMVVALVTGVAGSAQVDPPYKRFPSPPPAKLLLTDSSSYFTKDDIPKKSAVLYMLFSPMCDHCKHETEELKKNIDRFKNIFVVMATTQPFDSMVAFYNTYGLSKYDNIVVGRDFGYFLPSFYMIHNLPFHAFYNRKKELIDVFEGSPSIEKILSFFREK